MSAMERRARCVRRTLAVARLMPDTPPVVAITRFFREPIVGETKDCERDGEAERTHPEDLGV